LCPLFLAFRYREVDVVSFAAQRWRDLRKLVFANIHEVEAALPEQKRVRFAQSIFFRKRPRALFQNFVE